LCPKGEDTSYRVRLAIKDPSDPQKEVLQEESAFSVKPSASWPSTNPDHIFVAVIRGEVKNRISWLQFHVYCGKSKEPFYVTPRLTAKDLVMQDERNYYYFVK